MKRLDSNILKITLHLLQIFGFNAEMGPASNPLLIGAEGKPFTNLFVGQIGDGLAEMGVLMLLTLCLLSLYNAPFRAKIGAVVIGVVWIGNTADRADFSAGVAG